MLRLHALCPGQLRRCLYTLSHFLHPPLGTIVGFRLSRPPAPQRMYSPRFWGLTRLYMAWLFLSSSVSQSLCRDSFWWDSALLTWYLEYLPQMLRWIWRAGHVARMSENPAELVFSNHPVGSSVGVECRELDWLDLTLSVTEDVGELQLQTEYIFRFRE